MNLDFEVEKRVAKILATQFWSGWSKKDRCTLSIEEYKQKSLHNWMSAARGILNLIHHPHKFIDIPVQEDNSIYIAVDFDGTCVEHACPNIGKDIGAAIWLKKFIELDVKILLNTMRSDNLLLEAQSWFVKNRITLSGVNKNPSQHYWTNSSKTYAHIYIDDAAVGCPLTQEGFVNWDIVGPETINKIMLLKG